MDSIAGTADRGLNTVAEPDQPQPPPQQPPIIGMQEALLLDTGEPESELDKIIKMILDAANIGHLTELNQNEINAFSKAYSMCTRHPKTLKSGKALIAQNLIFRVSKSRKGRGEFIKILNRSISAQEALAAQQQRPGFFGRRRG